MPATKADNKSDNSRLECMELKIDKLTEIIEKYDIPSVADKAQKANENFNVFNNSCKEYITRLNKAMQVLDKSITNNENISHKSECPDTEQKFKERGKEINALRSSELLLLTLIKEKDNSISELRSSKDKNIKTINENNSSIQLLRQQVDKYKDMEMKLNEQHRVIDRLNDTVSDPQSKSSERELLLDKQCVTQQHDIRSKQELINILSSQLKEEHDARKTLEGNLSASLLRSSTFKQVQAENSEAVRPTLTPNKDDKTHKVIIFHDSLCKNINESLMGREDVTVSKVWAPTLRDSQAKVGEVDKVDTIVIQGLTRDLDNISAEELSTLTYETVGKCLLKSEKVVVSLVVNREDDDNIRTKLGVVNANIRYKYLTNHRRLVSHQENLVDRKYMIRDQLHLTEFGTSRLANKLKYKIAESLGITVRNKRFNDKNETPYNRLDNSWYQSNRYNGRRQNDEYSGFNGFNGR